MKTLYVDTHCHLTSAEFKADRSEVVDTAAKKGVEMISSAITPQEWQECLNLAGEMPGVHASLGLDPMLYEEVESALSWIRSNSKDIVAVGEVGLDHYLVRDHAARALQEEAFRKLIGLVQDLRLPLQVHSRSAGKRALQILYDSDAAGVHLHAFDGRASLARVASYEYDYYFSIPTSIVRSQQKRKLAKAINIERLLIETDSPVLSPERGSRNTPANVSIALEETAEILNRDKEELRELVLENTLRLYNRLRPR